MVPSFDSRLYMLCFCPSSFSWCSRPISSTWHPSHWWPTWPCVPVCP
uniref:Uncharacterized protein n=1 Tax=Anguilla anguilla TaxID=7936 RepID=A0A0E9TAC6_ANGAN